jgi:hypothetical protein
LQPSLFHVSAEAHRVGQLSVTLATGPHISPSRENRVGTEVSLSLIWTLYCSQRTLNLWTLLYTYTNSFSICRFRHSQPRTTSLT